MEDIKDKEEQYYTLWYDFQLNQCYYISDLTKEHLNYFSSIGEMHVFNILEDIYYDVFNRPYKYSINKKNLKNFQNI